MTCNDLEAYLVDYLTGELEPAAVESIETHLRDCPACAAEVHGLRGVVATLDATRLPLESVAEMSRIAPESGSRRQRRPLGADPQTPSIRLFTAALRYAAVILFAFYIGWWYRGDAGGGPSPASGGESPAPIVFEPSTAAWRAKTINPQVAAGFEAAAAAFPRSSSFSRSLLAFSRR